MSFETAALGLTVLILLSTYASAESGYIAGIDIGAEYEARVRAGIEHNRKSSARIEVVDAKNRKVVGAKVSVKQTSHDFLFGCAFPLWHEPPKRLGKDGWDNWNRYFTRLFNYTTSENSLKWGPIEPQEGVFRWEPVDFMISWCRERNIKIKGHNLIWGLPKHGFPEWLEKYSPDEIAIRARDHIRTLMSRCREDWTPKPAYYALDDLINNKWKTNFESYTDTNGEVRFRGFYGDYEVTVTTASGKTMKMTMHVAKDSNNVLRIEMPRY